jgi:AbrB family looped-hinge helix DNA binding protein
MDHRLKPLYYTIMTIKLTIDKGGRIVIPKPIRRQLRLEPGDSLVLESQSEHMTLKPIRPAVGLKKEHGVWVYRSEQPQKFSASELVEQDRDRRIRELMG